MSLIKILIRLNITQTSNIGRNKPSNDCYFDGKVDNFQLFNRALSKEEIACLYK